MLVALVSDLQTGLRTSTFNSSVLMRRMRRFGRTCFILAEAHNEEEVKVLLLGDLVHGERVGRLVNVANLEFSVEEQKEKAVEAIGAMLAEMEGLKVSMASVPGNHGIRGRYFSRYDNIDNEIAEKLGVEAREYVKVEKVGKWRFLMLHGHQIGGMYPISAIVRRVVEWKSFYRFDVVVMGHFHTPSMLWAGLPIFMNGTAVSDDEYLIEGMGRDGYPAFWVLGIGEAEPISWMRLVRLE